ncbi:hypothetical protein PM015_18020, partial [Halorubrum ezzemoulense]|uniref:hypothetical protein n=1 Tax=Halorubrum ezzemoulense TaxID=337243 RepID=UPI00232D007C
LGIGFAVAVSVSRRLGSVTINGETVALAPSVSDLFVAALIVVLAVLFVKEVPRLISEAYKSGEI